jgi:hypothetical protein
LKATSLRYSTGCIGSAVKSLSARYSYIALCSLLCLGMCRASSLSSSSQAQCLTNPPVTSQSSSAPVASSDASCFQSFSFSNVSASASGTASYGSLMVTGNDGSKDLSANFQASTSFNDTLHLYGSNPNSSSNDVLAQFTIKIEGSPADLSPLPFPSQGFSATFTGGNPGVSAGESCTFNCLPFSQVYVVTQDDGGSGELSFSADLTGFGSESLGGGSVTASLDLQSIVLLDPTSGKPLAGFSYSSDSDTAYSVNATFIPEPATWFFLIPGVALLVVVRQRRNAPTAKLNT